MEYKPLHFIGKEIKVEFDVQPLAEKKPDCPDRFTWEEQTYKVTETLAEWQDFSRRGRMALNMRPANAAKAKRRGSWGVGRYYFRIRTNGGQIFDIYYDRAPKDIDDRKGSWFLFREMNEAKK